MRITRKKGFTLVEMAIVLVIIGIILAGVMKGRDIVRGSQVKQFSQGFAQKWVTIASTYYDKTGQVYCDGGDNGGVSGGSPNGYMDGLIPANRGTTQRAWNLEALQDVGITPCTMIKSDLEDDDGATSCTNGYNIWSRTIEGEFSGNVRVSVGYFGVILGANGPIRNSVVITNVPVDVAKGLDTLVDGQADGSSGSCVCLTQQGTTVVTGGSAVPTSLSWGGEPTDGSTNQIGLVDWGDADGGELCTVGLVMDY